MRYTGGRHCGRVAFELEAERPIDRVDDCNCSLCSKKGHLHGHVTRDASRLLASEAETTAYRFNTGTAIHDFCKACGIASFCAPRSHLDPYRVNTRCIDGSMLRDLQVDGFDGVHWEEAAGRLDRERATGAARARVRSSGTSISRRVQHGAGTTRRDPGSRSELT